MGTPRYMAPEQVTGEPVDARSDLFAAGAILFEMLAGRPAFGGPRRRRDPARHAPRAAAGADRFARRRRRRSRDPPGAGEAAGATVRFGRGDGGGAARDVRGVASDDTPVARARAHAPRRAAVSRAAARSRDRFPRLQPARRDRDVVVGHRLARRALQRRGRALRRRGARPQGAGGRGRRRSRRDGHAAARRRSTARRRRSSSRRRAGRCSHRTRFSRRSAICSGCRTTSRGASSRRCRCRSPAAPRSRRPMRRTTRAPTSSTCGRTSWRALRRARRGARSVSALPRAGSALRAGVGAARPLPPRHRQVHR